MSAPEAFHAILADANGHNVAERRRQAFDVGSDSSACQRDELDNRIEAYLAAGPVAGKEVEYQIVLQLREIEDGLADISRSLSECNKILARTNGRMIQFLNTPSALDDLHAC